MTWPEIWEGETPGARSIRILLYPASLLYQCGWRIYRLLYDLGFKTAASPHVPIICVGNLVAGGSGKTTATVCIAKLLLARGYSLVVSASGYGGRRSADASLAPEGPLDAAEWGDEPALLRDALPGVPLIVGKDRVRAARVCREAHPDAVLLLDDGFQHLPLTKHINILIDPPLRNHACLPAGPNREPQSFLRRADLVIGPSTRFRIDHGELEHGLPSGTKVSALCAIGDPGAFVRALEASGLVVGATRFRPDHDPLDTPNLFEGLPEPVVVTAKDAVKLRKRSEPFVTAHRPSKIEPESEFAAWLEGHLADVRQ